ncbi:hypothetical protein BS333_13755 [Vibrio azureus]|uniref:Uncharacterized protein n=3 Tax=Vibrio azureus TaxID=512649 RepID=U3AVM3_9VIBR|nr:TcfC E-set like domain-containing protein [Vibrio azureus]AUI87483.1 hypothetical protein BS333_13755 [Vibrio azureus]GAD77277.1 hypothetical protein VAZ01S_069_00250 [Vibrio azureus NBRC 104587]
MSNFYVLFFISILQFFHANVYSKGYPDNFSEYFIEKNKMISIRLAGINESVDTEMLVSYESIKLVDYSSNINVVRSFLDDKGIKGKTSSDIISILKKGLNRSEILSKKNHEREYVLDFDYDNSILEVILSPSAFKSISDEKEYIEYENKSPAMINWSNFYLSSEMNKQPQLNWSNNTTVGLPIGFLSIDTQIDTRGNTDVFEAMYSYEKLDNLLKFGYSENTLSFNSTDYLSNDTNYISTSAYVASSRQLIKNKTKNSQKIIFSASENGQVEVYKSERIIYSKSISEGKNFISYDDLPVGSYKIVLVFKALGEEVFREEKRIVNNNDFQLETGRYDHTLNVGLMENSKGDDFFFSRGLLNYRIDEPFMIGSGITLSEYGHYFQIGSKYLFKDDWYFEGTGGVNEYGDSFTTLNFRMSFFDFYYSHLDLKANTNSFDLINTLYRDNSYREFGIGASGLVLGGTGYIRLSQYSDNKFSYYQKSDRYDYRMVYSSLNYHLSSADITLSADYQRYETRDSSFNISLSLQLKFDEIFSASNNVYVKDNNVISIRNSLSMIDESENFDSNTSVSLQAVTNRSFVDFSSSIQSKNQKFNSNAYVYVDSLGRKSLSGSASGTQIFSDGSLDFTNLKGRSFIKLRRDNFLAAKEESVYVSSSKNGRFISRKVLNKDSNVTKLVEYQQQEILIEPKEKNTLIKDNTFDVTSLPGTLYTVSPKAYDVENMIVILDDEFGNPISSLDCAGETCIDVQQISDDGVFQVTYIKGSNFNLSSNSRVCNFKQIKNSTSFSGVCI